LPQLWMDPIHGLAVSIQSSLSGLSGGPIFTTGDLQKERLSWRTPEKSIRFRGFTVPIVAGLKNRWKKGKDSNSAPALQGDFAEEVMQHGV